MSYAIVDGMLDQTRSGSVQSPVSGTMQMRLVEFSRGEAVYEMEARPELANPLGVIQGGVVSVLADAAMAAATTTMLTDEEVQREAITTVDLFSRFLRPVQAGKTGTLRAEAKIVRGGARLMWAEATVLADDKPVAMFAATGIRVPFDPAAYLEGASSAE